MLSPTVVQTAGTWRWVWAATTPLHLVQAPWVAATDLEAGVVSPQILQLASLVAAQTKPREILWSNMPHAIGLLAALANRPTSSAMLYEVGPAQPFDALRAAHLVIWFKVDPLPEMAWRTALAGVPMMPVAENDLAFVFRHSQPTPHAEVPRPLMPLGFAWLLLGTVVAGIIWDLSRHRTRIPV
jgi:hypothetical protein